jgi:hypothetical protein
MSGPHGLIDAIDQVMGGALTSLAGALAGRFMWHSGEVKLGKRNFFGKELLWEIPVAVGMALIGEALASYLELQQPVSTGLVAALAYLGPRGAEALLSSWWQPPKPPSKK